jgi:AmmeMemoRadiSam system protein A
VAHRALGADIVHNTRRAMVDPRLAPVDASEWPELWISVSLLSEPEPLDVDGLDSLCAALRPGVDGLTLRQDLRRATFLPSVWESIDEPGKFVAQLLRKGGWEPGSWPAGMTAEIYHAHSHSSEPPRPPLGES